MFLLSSDERSPYRSAAHNATALSVSSSLFIGAREEKSYAYVNARATGAASTVKVHRGERAAYGPSDVHAAHVDAKVTRESDGVLFTRRVAETRRPIDLHERPIKVVRCTSVSGRRQEKNVYSLESSGYSRLRARQAF